MATFITPNKKPVAATIRDRLNLVSTTHPLGKEQVDVYYHDAGERV